MAEISRTDSPRHFSFEQLLELAGVQADAQQRRHILLGLVAQSLAANPARGDVALLVELERLQQPLAEGSLRAYFDSQGFFCGFLSWSCPAGSAEAKGSEEIRILDFQHAPGALPPLLADAQALLSTCPALSYERYVRGRRRLRRIEIDDGGRRRWCSPRD